jgi:dethiobiotin synthetase
MAALFIAGTGTDVGKTYVAAALIRALKSRGVAVDALKPVVSGFDPAAPQGSDPAILLDALGIPLSAASIEHIAPWRYRAPLAPDQAALLEGLTVVGHEVVDLSLRRIDESAGRLLVIEGAGGIMSPLDETMTMLDFARALDVPVLLVAGSYLGTISHTLTAARVNQASGARLAAVVVSESSQAPPMGPTLAAIAGRLGSTPIFGLTRGGAPERPLLDLIAQGVRPQ